MPTILQVLPALNGGGVERGTVDIARAIAEKGWGSFVASSGGRMESQIEEAGAKHIPLPLASKNPATILHNAFRLAKIIRENGVNIIHARSRVPAWSAYFAAKMTKIPLVTTFHGVYSGTSALKKKYNSVMTYGDRVIAVSEFIKKHIHDNYQTDMRKVEVIHRGVDMDAFSPEKVDEKAVDELRQKWQIPNGKQVIFMPARITRWKGQAVFIDALLELPHRDFYCVIAGVSGKHENFKSELQAKISEANADDVIKIVDAVSDMTAGLTLADIVVCPSLRPEAFGRIPIEASAMKKPIIATAHGGAMETVIDGKTGLLVPPDNAVELSAAIEKGLLNHWFDGEFARQHVEEYFSLGKMCRRTIEIYEGLL